MQGGTLQSTMLNQNDALAEQLTYYHRIS